MKNKYLLIVFFNIFILTSLSFAKELTLSKAYNLALENSNKLNSSELNLDSKKEDLNQVKANLYPQISGEISYSNRKSHFNELLNRTVDLERERSIDYSLKLNQTLFDAEVYSKINLEKKRLKLYEVNVEKDKKDLLLDIVDKYMKVFKIKNNIDLLTSEMKYYKYINSAAEKQIKLNLINKMDLLESQVNYNMSVVKLKKEEKLLEISMQDLKKTIEFSNFSMPKINYAIAESKLLELNESISKDLYKNSIEMKEALLSKEFSQEEVKNSKTAFVPKLSLNASYTKYDSTDLSSDYEDTSRIIVSLKIPIYSGGLKLSKLESSKLKYLASLEDMKHVEKTTSTMFDEYRNQFNSSLQLVLLSQNLIKSGELYLKSIEQGFSRGLKSLIDLYEAKVKLNEIKSDYIESTYTLIESYTNLVILSGNYSKILLLDDLIVSK